MQKKVLVVDDDDLVLYGLEKALKAGGVEVDTAATAAEAVRRLSTCPYDLCLLDVHLPDFSGMVLMKIIRDICPKVKVIIMTASCLDDCGLSENVREAVQNGACHFLAKPFNLYELKEIVIEALHSDDTLQSGFRVDGDGFSERKGRRQERRSFSEELAYSLRVIRDGEDHRLLLSAQALDISEHGVGLLTNYPLRPDQVLSFEHESLNRSGLVAWSTMLDDRTCRAGIHFT